MNLVIECGVSRRDKQLLRKVHINLRQSTRLPSSSTDGPSTPGDPGVCEKGVPVRAMSTTSTPQAFQASDDPKVIRTKPSRGS